MYILNIKYLLLCLLASVALINISGCKDSDDDIGSGEAGTLSEFSFLVEHNPTLKEDIDLIITDNNISGIVPFTLDTSVLIPSVSFDGVRVEVDGELQRTGNSAQDFRREIIYTVIGTDSSRNAYRINVQFFTGLPILKIKTDNNQPIVSKENYINGTIEVFGGRSYEDLEPMAFRIRGRGNSTWNAPKKPYQIRFEDKESLLSMDEDKRWILLANYSDKSLLRNEVAFTMGRLSSLDWTPDSRFVELIINDEYQGSYQLTQKVEETSNRVDVGNDGFLLEIDQLSRLDPDDVYFETDRHLFNIKEPNVDLGDSEYEYIKGFISNLEDVLFSEYFRYPQVGYRKYIDVKSFADWYIINELTRNNDAIFFTSVFMNLVPGEKLQMGPIWDFDIAMGNINYNGNEATEGFWIKKARWIKRLFEDPYFVDIVQSRMEYFSDNRVVIFDKIKTDSRYLEDSQTRNFERWMILGEYVWPNYVYYDTYEEEVEYLETWLAERWDWMDIAISEL